MVAELKNKSLLIISPHFLTFVRDQVDELKKYFKSVHVICPTPYFPKALSKLKFIPHHYKQAALSQDFNYDNVFVYFPRFFHLPIEFFRRRIADSWLRAVLRTIKKNNISFDIIHAHFTYPSGYVAVKLKEKFNVPVVVTVHENRNWFLKEFESKEKRFIYVWKNADMIIRVNKKDVPLLKKYNSNVINIPNGFDENKFRPMDKFDAKEKLRLPKDKKIILNVANYKINHKNQLNLIKAAKLLRKKRKDFLLYLIGNHSPDSPKIESFIKEMNAEQYVKMLGPKPHEEIPLWMNAADVFVLPSYSEGNPTVMFEALGCGLPFVGTKVGGIPEIITSEEYGFLLDDPNDYLKLAKLIDKALNKKWNKEKILRYSERFTWGQISNMLISIYFQLSKEYKKSIKQ